jgi:hypothetical protein
MARGTAEETLNGLLEAEYAVQISRGHQQGHLHDQHH